MKEITVLVKVFPIELKDGMQAEVEAIVQEFAPAPEAPFSRWAGSGTQR